MEITATEFKAKCLALLDQVAQGGERIRITKRGKAVAELVAPTPTQSELSPQASLKGSVEILGDVCAPVLPAEVWEAEGEHSDADLT
ncbi:MAG: type II toxin-antitoxin system Phd/YefM family antitoxin [Polyangiales bacterium]